MKKQRRPEERRAEPRTEPRTEPTPHDRYFRHVFTQPEPMRDLVLNVVVPELSSVGAGAGGGAAGVQGTELQHDPVVTLEPSSKSFVDERLREHRTDLLVVLRTASGAELGVYLLFEHKARNERNTILQFMRYHAAVHMNRFAHFRYLVFDVELSMSDTFVGGPVTRTALQAMYAASRKLGKKGVLELVRLLAHPELPGEFRNTTLRYLQNGRQDNTNELLAALKKEGYTEMGNTISTAERERIQAVADAEKLQAALDEIIEPEATLESVLRNLK